MSSVRCRPPQGAPPLAHHTTSTERTQVFTGSLALALFHSRHRIVPFVLIVTVLDRCWVCDGCTAGAVLRRYHVQSVRLSPDDDNDGDDGDNHDEGGSSPSMHCTVQPPSQNVPDVRSSAGHDQGDYDLAGSDVGGAAVLARTERARMLLDLIKKQQQPSQQPAPQAGLAWRSLDGDTSNASASVFGSTQVMGRGGGSQHYAEPPWSKDGPSGSMASTRRASALDARYARLSAASSISSSSNNAPSAHTEATNALAARRERSWSREWQPKTPRTKARLAQQRYSSLGAVKSYLGAQHEEKYEDVVTLVPPSVQQTQEVEVVHEVPQSPAAQRAQLARTSSNVEREHRWEAEAERQREVVALQNLEQQLEATREARDAVIAGSPLVARYAGSPLGAQEWERGSQEADAGNRLLPSSADNVSSGLREWEEDGGMLI